MLDLEGLCCGEVWVGVMTMCDDQCVSGLPNYVRLCQEVGGCGGWGVGYVGVVTMCEDQCVSGLAYRLGSVTNPVIPSLWCVAQDAEDRGGWRPLVIVT